MLPALGVAGVVMGIGKIGGAIISLGADMEQTKVSFSVMLGSMDKANKMVDDINAFANVTPFENDTLFETTKLLLNYGVAQDKMMPTLKRLGDVSGGSAEKMQRLALAYGQARSLGRLQGQDMKQMIEVGFNPLSEMARTTGKSIAELSKMMGKGQISIKMLDDAFISATSKGGKFNNMMEKQSQTFTGKMSTFMGKLKMIGITIGTKLIPILSKFLDILIKAVDWVGTLSFNFSDFNVGLKDLTKTLGFLNKEFELKGANKGAGGLKKASDMIGSFSEKLRSGAMAGLKGAIKYFVWLETKIFQAYTVVVRFFKAFDYQTGFDAFRDKIMKVFNLVSNKINYMSEKLDVFKENNKETLKWIADLWDKVFGYIGEKWDKLVEKFSLKGTRFEGIFDFDENGTGKNIKKILDKSRAKSSKVKNIFSEPATGGTVKDAQNQINKITGSAPKVFNLNITKMVENFSVNTTNMQQGGAEIKDYFLELLQGALVDIQTNVR